MAVPKSKTSKQRSNSRSSANLNLTAPAVAECAHCHEPVTSHTVCPKCGWYKGREVLKIEKKKKK